MKSEGIITDLVQEFLLLGPPPLIENIFIANKIPGNPALRIAKDQNGSPALLISMIDDGNTREGVTIPYKHIIFSPKRKCKIQTDTTISEYTIALISCSSEDPHLREYFLRSLSGVISAISQNPTRTEVFAILEKLLELFRLMSAPSRNSIQGIWGEMLIIYLSTNSENAIRAWHVNPDALYDFDDGYSAIEVKTVLGDNRYHHFSINQLNPPQELKLAIASIILHEDSRGATVYDLLVKIVNEKGISSNALGKVHSLILSTLGKEWFDQKSNRFSVEDAIKSLKLFQHKLIPQIAYPLPQGVKSVSFISDLSYLPALGRVDIAVDDELLNNVFSGINTFLDALA